MNRLLRFALLVVPPVLGLVSLALPGRAQTPGSARFAFADTTLLRDTLELSFEGLFELSDSLGMRADTVRAISVRYRLGLDRLVALADSLGMPVDSVGPVLERERFNPLAAGARDAHSFRYTSTYNIARTSRSWTNGGDYNLVRGPVFVRNTTNIVMDRFRAGGRTSLRQTRSAVTEGGWRFTPNLSIGGVANLNRFDTFDPAAIGNEGENRDEFQLSIRTRQQPSRGVTSEINLRGGVLDLVNSQQEKRGASGDVSGRLRIVRGAWFTGDLNGTVSGNAARTRPPNLLERIATRDYNNQLRGTLGLFTNAPVGLNVNYSLRNLLVQTPTDTGTVLRTESAANGADATLRVRQDSERYASVTGRWGNSEQVSAALLNSLSTKDDLGLSAEGRYAWAGYALDVRFSNATTRSEFPRRSADGGYGESLHVRSIQAEVSRAFGPRLTVRANGQVSLSSFRYYLIGAYTTPPSPRDSYRQSYRIDGNYTRSDRVTSGLGLEVIRTLSINIPGSAAAANTEVRTYRAEWRWTFRLLEGLTATQRNQLTADYTFYPFNPRSDRLNLEYGTLTTLNAVLSPRFTVDVTHNSRYQPSGDYEVSDVDGLRYFSLADETQVYSLSARIAYTPTPGVSFQLQPDYLANDRDGTDDDGNVVPQRRTRSLNLSGGANLNVPIGGKARLSGDIRRSFQSTRTTSFTAGRPDPSPRGESDFWQGSLQLSWEM